MGARIEPCGTRQESLAGNEEKLPNLTEKLLFVRYDLNQLKTFPGCPQNILESYASCEVGSFFVWPY